MGKFYTISRIRAENGSPAGRIDLFGEISATEFWGDEVTPSGFITDLNALGAISEIEIHIFSNGGDPFAAFAIYSEIKRRAEKVNIYIDGIAASAATLILCAGDTVYMDETAMLMIHNPYQVIFLEGLNADAARELAAELDKIREPMITAYMKKSGKSREEVIALMDGETGSGTWLTAAEAMEFGLADEYTPEAKQPLEVAACISPGVFSYRGHRVDLTGFDKAAEKTAGKIISMRGGNSMAFFKKKKNKKEPAAQVKPKAEITFVETVCPSCGGLVNLNAETGEIYAGSTQETEPQGADQQGQGADQNNGNGNAPAPAAKLARRMPGNVKSAIYNINCPHCGNDYVWDTDANADGSDGQAVSPTKPVGGSPAQEPAQPDASSQTAAQAAQAVCPNCNAQVDYDTETAETGTDEAGVEGYLLTCSACNTQFLEPFAAADPSAIPVGTSAEAQAAYRAGVLAERNRQQALDEMAAAAPNMADMIQAAKKSGASAEIMSRNVIKAMAAGNGGNAGPGQFAAALRRDVAASGVNDLKNPQHAGKPMSVMQSAYERYAAEYNKGRGGNKNGKA